MSNPRKPLRFNVGHIINSPIGTVREFDFDVAKYQIDPELLLTNFTGLVKVSRTPQGLYAEARFEADTVLECVRCLSDYPQHIEFTYEELFAFTKDNMTDSELLVPDDAHLDLQTLTYDYAVLAFPIVPTCNEDCKGLCKECGQNLNEKDCGHDQHSSDSPFEVLKDLL